MNFKSQKEKADCWVIIPAAGIGSRMNCSFPKQYLALNGRPLIEYCLQRFLALPWVKSIVVAVNKDDQRWSKLALSSHPKIKTIIGGDERVDTVSNAINSIAGLLDDDDIIMVHDAARPCITETDLYLLYDALNVSESGAVLADKLSDTIKRDDGNQSIFKTESREGLWRALTPQAFPKDILIDALRAVKNEGVSGITDEASAVEYMGFSPRLVQGRSDNIKVTKSGDIALASLILDAIKLSEKPF